MRVLAGLNLSDPRGVTRSFSPASLCGTSPLRKINHCELFSNEESTSNFVTVNTKAKKNGKSEKYAVCEEFNDILWETVVIFATDPKER